MKMNIFRIVIEKKGSQEYSSLPFGFYIETNAGSIEEIQSAYYAGVQVVGVDILQITTSQSYSGYDELLEAYEKIKPLVLEGDLNISVAQKLMNYYNRKDFAKDSSIDDPEEYENDLIIDIPEYYVLWRAVTRLGNPNLIINETDQSLDIDIGGNSEFFS